MWPRKRKRADVLEGRGLMWSEGLGRDPLIQSPVGLALVRGMNFEEAKKEDI